MPKDKPEVPKNVNEGPMTTPEDMTLAEQDRRADLQAVIDGEAPDNAGAARQELEQLDNYGYSWPAHAGGYPVWQLPYDDAEQKRRHGTS